MMDDILCSLPRVDWSGRFNIYGLHVRCYQVGAQRFVDSEDAKAVAARINDGANAGPDYGKFAAWARAVVDDATTTGD